MCLLPRQVRQVYCGLVPGSNNHPPSSCCRTLGVAICGFTVALEMFLVYFHKTHVSVSLSYPCSCPNPLSLLVSLTFPHCADKQPGAMAAEEVTWGIFSGVLFAMPAVYLSEAEGCLSVVSLSAFHLCCDWMKSYSFWHTVFHVVCLINMGQGSTKSVYMNLVLLNVEREKNVCQFSFLSILSQCSTCNGYIMNSKVRGCCANASHCKRKVTSVVKTHHLFAVFGTQGWTPFLQTTAAWCCHQIKH